MTVLQEKIVNAIDNAGGSIGWSDLMQPLEYAEQQRALSEIRGLEQQGILKRNVVRNPDTGTVGFTVDKL